MWSTLGSSHVFTCEQTNMNSIVWIFFKPYFSNHLYTSLILCNLEVLNKWVHTRAYNVVMINFVCRRFKGEGSRAYDAHPQYALPITVLKFAHSLHGRGHEHNPL